MPAISVTEKEALDAGDVWFESSIFQGQPDFKGLVDHDYSQLSDKETQFIEGPLEELLTMIDDYEIQSSNHVPEPIMEHLKKHKFFSFIIPERFGGLEFSYLANSTIVGLIAARSSILATVVIVPNSLGCGELLAHYGTKEQQDYYLPRLVDGREIPCFALTSPEAGSDAGSIPDKAIVTTKVIDGEEQLGFECSWDKRYITNAPISTVIGLAAKVVDPNNVLGRGADLGITCILIPADFDGVEIGNRHDPLGNRFYNGTTRGKGVFVPIDNVIGGRSNIGKGWKMLMECLGAGRGVSIPAQSAAMIQGAFKNTSEYAYVREQFGTEIGNFEGVQEQLALMAGLTFTAEALRTTVVSSLDVGIKPSVLTAITKYHMSEMGRLVISAAMDVQAGKGIQRGPNNVLESFYRSIPVCITVEGANILTRNLMIFGQGATRCHPYIRDIIESIHSDERGADKAFNKLLLKTGSYSVKNLLRAFTKGWLPFFATFQSDDSDVNEAIKRAERLASILSSQIDFSMLTLGGDLKRKEMLSARLGDVISYLFLVMANTKFYLSINKPQLKNYYLYGTKWALQHAENALDNVAKNFPNRTLQTFLNVMSGKTWLGKTSISDKLITALAKDSLENSTEKALLMPFVSTDREDGYRHVTNAFLAKHAVKPLLLKIKDLKKSGQIAKNLNFSQSIYKAHQLKQVSDGEYASLKKYEKHRKLAISVDEFDFDMNLIDGR